MIVFVKEAGLAQVMVGEFTDELQISVGLTSLEAGKPVACASLQYADFSTSI
jgi:hypothetical protein